MMRTNLILFFLFFLSISVFSCRYKRVKADLPYIAEQGDVYIDSKPTNAMIYMNGHKLGKTPLVTKFWFTEKSELKITALPLFEGQYRQDIVLEVPAIPRKLTFFMTNKPEHLYSDGDEEEVLSLEEQSEEKPAQEVVPQVVFKAMPVKSPILFYEINEKDLNKEKIDTLIGFISGIKEMENIKIIIKGFADESGNRSINKNLSFQRAENVYKFLSENGIDGRIMEVYGHGEIYTLDKEGFYLEASVNRKVEIKVVPNEEDKSQ